MVILLLYTTTTTIIIIIIVIVWVNGNVLIKVIQKDDVTESRNFLFSNILHKQYTKKSFNRTLSRHWKAVFKSRLYFLTTSSFCTICQWYDLWYHTHKGKKKSVNVNVNVDCRLTIQLLSICHHLSLFRIGMNWGGGGKLKNVLWNIILLNYIINITLLRWVRMWRIVMMILTETSYEDKNKRESKHMNVLSHLLLSFSCYHSFNLDLSIIWISVIINLLFCVGEKIDCCLLISLIISNIISISFFLFLIGLFTQDLITRLILFFFCNFPKNSN